MSKKIYALITSLLFSAVAISFLPLPSVADDCQGSQCQVTFNFTGSAQTWQVPSGASNITFDIQGASGGRGGGLGGRITGTLVGNFSQLQIMVGGAGRTGMLADGGFNGGGRSGGNRTNEGSGGGASDIRTSGSLDSRLVVAGGGGGTGGYSGGPGGHGGGESANTGQSGQGGGGGGGSQSSGGQPGFNNGGMLAATAGSFGLGGNGGTSWNAGGGGGGGGWYGGGGGGSDDDDCCADGGGGGGGSSYAAPSMTRNIEHTIGYRFGDGVVIIRYELVPQLVSFQGEQIDSDSVVFIFEYSLQPQGLEVTDFTVSESGCQISNFVLAGNRATITLDQCESSPQLLVSPGAFSVFSAEPQATLSATVALDQTPPQINFSASSSSLSNLVLTGEVLDALQNLSTESVTVSGCQIVGITASPALSIGLSDCAEGEAIITIAKAALSDQFGNISDTISHAVVFDYSAPVIFWQRPSISGSETFALRAVLQSNEPFSLSNNAIQVSGSASSCSQLVTNEIHQSIFEFQGCPAGELVLSVTPGSITDSLGNIGPASTVSLAVTLAAPIVPAPQQPTAQEPWQPVAPEVVVTESESVQEPETDSEDVSTSQQIENEPLVEGFSAGLTEEDSSQAQEPSPVAPTSEVDSDSAFEAQPVFLETKRDSQPESKFWLGLLGVVLALSLGGVGALVLRLSENNRSRTVK